MPNLCCVLAAVAYSRALERERNGWKAARPEEVTASVFDFMEINLSRIVSGKFPDAVDKDIVRDEVKKYQDRVKARLGCVDKKKKKMEILCCVHCCLARGNITACRIYVACCWLSRSPVLSSARETVGKLRGRRT
ncbi:hypothetical protein NDU88_007630 [Pleurodeles waltl]|uniref:Uncharacterized protein n=1 Tax=Pleurodeles waltl TaxID=8319 RepID=A0AAV7PQS6_PLEWA|nr:hypothetical protein NDU88_007630 [Pleurodeles waltl]